VKEYKKKYPLFSLCGLNCGLCPRYQTSGSSKCPGCGGPDFHLKHPSCAVITCNRKHDNVEFCFQCSSYPCKKYRRPGKTDSFISYRNVITDFKKAGKKGIDKYKIDLDEKVRILEFLLKNYNDGKRKNFYCVAMNLLDLIDIRSVIKQIDRKISRQDMNIKDRTKSVIDLFESRAKNKNIDLKLRKR
jgi:hypothetical protein